MTKTSTLDHQDQPPQGQQPEDLRTVPQIAREINRAAQSVYRIIERLNIQPSLVVGGQGIKLYAPTAIPMIEGAMRRPNHNHRR